MAGRFFPVQSFHLGPTGDYKTANMTAAQLPYAGAVGQIIEDGGKAWRLVQSNQGVGTVATVDGGVAYWRDKVNGVVTPDASDGEALANGVAGGYHGVVTHTNYCFIQCGGDQAAVIVAASAVKGDHLTGHASNDNVLTRTAGGTAPVDKLVAVALTTRGTTTSDVGGSIANSSKVRWELGALL